MPQKHATRYEKKYMIEPNVHYIPIYTKKELCMCVYIFAMCLERKLGRY